MKTFFKELYTKRKAELSLIGLVLFLGASA